MTQQETHGFLPSLILHLKEVASEHYKLIDPYLWGLQLQQPYEDRYKDARHNLLTFNRGARAFCRSLLARLQAERFNQSAGQMKGIAESLDLSWITLFADPTNAACGKAEDYEEHSLMLQITNAFENQDGAAIQQITPLLINFDGSSLIAESILMCIDGDIQTSVAHFTKLRDAAKHWSQWWYVEDS